MAKKKRVKTRKSVKSNVKPVHSPKVWRAFYTFLFSLVVSLVLFGIANFIKGDLWLVSFVMLALLFGVLAFAFFLIWLVLLVMKWIKK